MKDYRNTVWMAILTFLVLLASTSAQAQSKAVRLTWDAAPAVDVPNLDGYNVYQVVITPPIKPADFLVNIPTPLPAGHTLTLTKVNESVIPAVQLEYVVKNATPGMQLVVAATNTTWGDGPISDIVTLRPLPPKPAGLKAVALLIEASKDLVTWAPFAAIEAALSKDEFFRMHISK